jgi:hypothetical protein
MSIGPMPSVAGGNSDKMTGQNPNPPNEKGGMSATAEYSEKPPPSPTSAPCSPGGDAKWQNPNEENPTWAKLNDFIFLLVNAMFLSMYLIPLYAIILFALYHYGYLASGIFSLIIPVFATIAVLDLSIPVPQPPYMNHKLLEMCGLQPAMRRYYPAAMINKCNFKKDKNYLLSGHPHGLWFQGFCLLFPELYFTYGFRMLFTGASAVMYMPILRRFMSWIGFIKANKKEMIEAMSYKFPYNILVNTTGEKKNRI